MTSPAVVARATPTRSMPTTQSAKRSYRRAKAWAALKCDQSPVLTKCPLSISQKAIAR
jgi:hypothetical protein